MKNVKKNCEARINHLGDTAQEVTRGALSLLGSYTMYITYTIVQFIYHGIPREINSIWPLVKSLGIHILLK